MHRTKKLLLPIFIALLQSSLLCAQDISKVFIDIELKNARLEEAFSKIESATPFRFNYKAEDVSGVRSISYSQRHASVKKVLTDLLSGTSLQYEQVKQYIIIKKAAPLPERSVTLYGFVTTDRSGETLNGATVILSGGRTYFSVTNNYGFYSMTVPAGLYQLSCTYVGFRDYGRRLELDQTARCNIEMPAGSKDSLPDVVVTSAARKSIVRNALTGYHHLDMPDIKKIAMAGGEPDVLKSLQFLPGVQTSNEGTTNLSVRGGSYDQNLILLDEAPVYNPTHSLGFFSIFNTEALKDVSIYKGVFPAQYGGRLSSVVDVRMKEGNTKEQAVSGGIGLLASRLTWEGPVKKEKSSFMLSARYSNTGILLNTSKAFNFIKLHITDSRISFYDLNAKINPILGNKDRLFLSVYTGHDKFFLNAIDASNLTTWANTIVSARWNHVFHPSLFANTSLLYSRYNYTNNNLNDSRNINWTARMQELTLKTDFEWGISSNNRLKWGLGITGQEVQPGRAKPRDISVGKPASLRDRRAAQVSAYISNEQRISRMISLSYGLRATVYAQLGSALVYRYNADTTQVFDSMYYPSGKIVKTYSRAEPRITARFLLSGSSSLKISYGRNYQFQHLLTSSSVGLPTDIWMPSDTWFKPQYSDQFAAGIYKTFHNETYETSTELYYSSSRNVLDFKDNAEIFLNEKIETQVLTGQAKGYGLEWLLKKNKGASTGWISYTWSKALRRISGINNNEWYPPSFDHRHNISLVYHYAINKRWNFSANWVYRSGGHITAPVATYVFGNARVIQYGRRNEYEMPAYHRMDLSLTLQEKRNLRRKRQGEWVFSVYNVYGRKNVFALFVSQDPYGYRYAKATEVYLTTVFPTVTYNFTF